MHGLKQRWSASHTVDGRNPEAVDMVNIPQFAGFCTSQVVQDCIHQPYQLVRRFSFTHQLLPIEIRTNLMVRQIQAGRNAPSTVACIWRETTTLKKQWHSWKNKLTWKIDGFKTSNRLCVFSSRFRKIPGILFVEALIDWCWQVEQGGTACHLKYVNLWTLSLCIV